jgi:hypothetical protein
MTPDELTTFLESERTAAKQTLLNLVPEAPEGILYEKLWPQLLVRHVIRRTDVNKIVAHTQNGAPSKIGLRTVVARGRARTNAD